MADMEENRKEEKPASEVIAQKTKGYRGAIVFTLVFGICMALFGVLLIVLGIVNKGPVPMYVFAGVMIAGGVGTSVYSGLSLKKINAIPAVIISREGDTLTFFAARGLSFSCKTGELTNVSYYQQYGRGQSFPWGTLVVYLGGTELKLHYVKDVVAAHNRLLAFVLENTKKAEKNGEQASKTDGEDNG